MIRWHWLRNLLDVTRSPKNRCRPAARSSKPIRLMLELLEDRITPSGFQSLYSFTGLSDGMNPRASVIADSSGNLYGTTYSGGANGAGNVFQYSPSSSKVTALQSFSSTTEQNPLTGLVQDSNGYLYGTTTTGGPNGDGTVFRLNSDGTAFTVLHSFSISDGSDPQGGLTIDGKGNIYGTTSSGGTSNDGTVFELSPNGSGGYNFSTLHNFAGGNDGRQPDSTLLLDSQGNLYGVTQVGGTATDGTVFELSPNGSGGYNFTTLHVFTGSDGFFPHSNLIMDGKGNLYGTTLQGGSLNDGTVYELSPNGSGSYTLTTLHTFNGGDGELPAGNWLMDSRGNFFGATLADGSTGNGTVYELSPNGSGGYDLATLHFFKGTDGATPWGGVTTDSSGNLYGTTSAGGSSSDGTIFEITGAVNTIATTTSASNVTATFSTTTQNVTLTASVSSGSGSVNEGTVTFTIQQGSTVIGTATTSETVSNGQASVSYALPANLAAGTYTIDAVYNTGPDFTGSSDTTHTLTVLSAPTVTTNPSDQTVTAGQTATFTAAASGNPTPTVQWQVSSDGGKMWTDLSGATSTTLTLTNVTADMNGYEYQAVLTNSVGSATTTAATLTVQTQPTISSGNNATFTIGQGGTFTLTATGSPTPTFSEAGALPGGLTFTDNGNGTATLGGVLTADTQGTYHFTITAHNGVGSDFTQSFTLTVNPAPVHSSPPRQPPVLNVPPLLALFNSLLGGTETINTNGTETVVDSLFGISLVVATYDGSGNFVGATLSGINVPNWVWSL